MKTIYYILSFLYPVTVELTGSSHNPFLEIVLFNGRYSLNSKNTNYSFGTLHTLFKKIFRKLNLNWININDVLILGFGTGSIAEIIGKFKPGCAIDGVEIDEKVLELGRRYFNTRSPDNVTIHCAPAEKFIEDCRKQYDLIVIDVFLDMIVPPEIETEHFLICVRNSLKPQGMVIFNKVLYTRSINEQMPGLINLYQKCFGNLEIMTVMRSGKIFIAGNNTTV
jgi:2-polyprenyl-3-methyl-5-hydroxy-6-metoxy-1,4-benzoquinol methylase